MTETKIPITSPITTQVPAELLNYLSDGMAVAMFGRKYDAAQCECGSVKLNSPADLSLIHVFQYTGSQSIFQAKFPERANTNQYYCGVAVDLLKKSDNYPPKGILTWLPDWATFATWDNSHDDLITFPGISWNTIAENPLPYLNAQWRASTEERLAGQLPWWEKWPLVNK